MLRKPKNILEAIRSRQYGYKNEQTERIFKETYEDLLITRSSFENLFDRSIDIRKKIGHMILATISPDGLYLAYLRVRTEVIIMNILTKTILKTLKFKDEDVHDVIWSPQSKGMNYVIGVACMTGIYVFISGREDHLFLKSLTEMDSISFHPIKPVMAAARGEDILFWDYESNMRMSLYNEDRQSSIQHAIYSMNGKYLLMEKVALGGSQQVHDIVELELSSDGTTLNSSSDNVITLEDGCLLNMIINTPYTMVAVHFGKNDRNEVVRIYSLLRGEFGYVIYELDQLSIEHSICFSPTSRYLILKRDKNDSCNIFFVININKRYCRAYNCKNVKQHLPYFCWSSNINVGIILY